VDSNDSSYTNTSSFRSGLGRGANSGWEWGSRSIRYPRQSCSCTHVLNNWHTGQLRLSLILRLSSNTAGAGDFMDALWAIFTKCTTGRPLSCRFRTDYRVMGDRSQLLVTSGQVSRIGVANTFEAVSLTYYQALRNDHTSFSAKKYRAFELEVVNHRKTHSVSAPRKRTSKRPSQQGRKESVKTAPRVPQNRLDKAINNHIVNELDKSIYSFLQSMLDTNPSDSTITTESPVR